MRDTIIRGVLGKSRVQGAKIRKCLQVFKEFGRVGGLVYLCSVKDCASRAQNIRNSSLSCQGAANLRE